MPDFVETYSAEMRAGLFRAAIDDKHGVRGALRLAGAGQMPDLEPAHQAILAGMSYGYAAELVARERERRDVVRQVHDDVTGLAHRMAARLAALADRELARVEAAKGKAPVDTGAAHAAGKLMREALALARAAAAPATAAAKQAPDTPAAPTRPASVAAMLAAADDDDDTTAADDAENTASDSGDSSAERSDDDDDTTHDRSTGAVRAGGSAAGMARPLRSVV